MIIGLTNLKGENVTWEDLKPKKWRDFGVSPATLIYLASNADRRKDVKGISASQWGKGLRLLWLERTRDVFVGPEESIAAQMGTAKHAHVLTEGYNDGETGIVTEKRYYDKSGRISAQIDQLVWHNPRLVEIVDLKTGKGYSLKKFKESPETSGYTYQLNLGADLVRLAHPGVSIPNLWLEWFPSDARRGDKKAEMIPVPLFEKGRALAEYSELLATLDGLIDIGDIPDMCSPEERWEKTDWKTKLTESVRCAGFCPFAKECIKVSHSIGEKHPLEEWG